MPVFTLQDGELYMKPLRVRATASMTDGEEETGWGLGSEPGSPWATPGRSALGSSRPGENMDEWSTGRTWMSGERTDTHAVTPRAKSHSGRSVRSGGLIGARKEEEVEGEGGALCTPPAGAPPSLRQRIRRRFSASESPSTGECSSGHGAEVFWEFCK